MIPTYEVFEKVSKALPQPFTNTELTHAVMKGDSSFNNFKGIQSRVGVFLHARVERKLLFINSYDRPRKYSYDPTDSVRPPSLLSKNPELAKKYEKPPVDIIRNGSINITIPRSAINMTIEVEGQIYEIKRVKL